jgi:hypothetical protein
MMIRTKFQGHKMITIDETIIILTDWNRTTWVEMFVKDDGTIPMYHWHDTRPAKIMNPVVITGDTKDIVAWAEKIVQTIHKTGIRTSDNNYEKPPVPLMLTREDWTEIYYALLHKQAWLQTPDPDKLWFTHLEKIINLIGPDGDIAAASGVEANG